MTKNLEELLISRDTVFEGELLVVQRDVVLLPDGKEASREYIKHPGACVVLAEVNEGVFLFERQYRHPLGKVFIELPAGKIDPGEDILTCAQRELLEETGCTAAQWTYLGVMHNCIGYSDEKIEIFHAQELKKGTASLDDGEFIEVFEMSIEEAVSAVLKGGITDSKTITCLFWMRELRR